MSSEAPFMDRARCLEVLRRMRDSLLISLLAPEWSVALARAVQLLEDGKEPPP